MAHWSNRAPSRTRLCNRCRFVSTLMGFDAPAVFPSNGVMVRHPLLSTGSLGMVPPLQRCRVGGGGAKGWPPSAAQTGRAVFPHPAFTRVRHRRRRIEGQRKNRSTSPGTPKQASRVKHVRLRQWPQPRRTRSRMAFLDRVNSTHLDSRFGTSKEWTFFALGRVGIPVSCSP